MDERPGVFFCHHGYSVLTSAPNTDGKQMTLVSPPLYLHEKLTWGCRTDIEMSVAPSWQPAEFIPDPKSVAPNAGLVATCCHHD